MMNPTLNLKIEFITNQREEVHDKVMVIIIDMNHVYRLY